MEGKKGLDMVLLRAYVPMTESGNAGQKEGKGNIKMVFNSKHFQLDLTTTNLLVVFAPVTV